MPLNRLPDYLSSNINLTGVSADYLDGVTSNSFSSSLRANRAVTGGGTITFDVSGNLFWSSRFIVISNGRGPTSATDGYYDINCPTSGTIIGVGGAGNRTATGAGISLAAWEALYAILPIAGGFTSTTYRVASYLSDFEIPHDWVLIAIRNGDTGYLYLNNGIVLAPGQSNFSGISSNTFVGASNTENYIAFRGTTGDNPGGFDHGYIGERIFSGGESSELLIFKGNDLEGVSGPDRIRLLASNIVFDTFTSVLSGTFSAVGATVTPTRMIISQSGTVSINSTSTTLGGTGSTTHQLGVISAALANVGFVIRGAAGQTGDLQQWQNSVPSVLASVNSSGHFSLPKINFTGGTTTISALTLADGTVSFEGSAGQLFSISNSLTGTIFSINDISGLPSVEVTDLGIIKLNELYGQTVVGSGTPVTSAQLSSIARTSTTIALAVKGAASQTANLQEWQNSSETILARIDSAGNATFTSIDGGTA